jgi:pimeloyl-ACP methyl ester carboxylesterase
MDNILHTFRNNAITILLVVIVIIVLVKIFKKILRHISHKYVLLPDKFDQYIYDRWIGNDNVINETIHTNDGESLDAMFYNKYKKPSYDDDIIYLYHHGNSGWVCLVLESGTCEYISKYGGSIFVYDYRGYGRSTGVPTDFGLLIDAIAAWNFLVNDKKVDPKRIVMFGHSLGTCVLANLVKYLLENQRPCCETLIFQNSFESIQKLCEEIVPYVGRFVPLDLSTGDCFDKIDELTSSLKIFFIHSNNDTLIDKKHSHNLVKRIKNNNTKLIIVPGTHDSLEYNNETHDLLLNLSSNNRNHDHNHNHDHDHATDHNQK